MQAIAIEPHRRLRSEGTEHSQMPFPAFDSVRSMPDPDVVAALKRADLPIAGRVGLFHATSASVAQAIEQSGVLAGDQSGQAWLASSREIATLHHAAGATTTQAAETTDISAVVKVAVDADDLFFETTRGSDTGDIELFYLIDNGSGCPVDIISVEAWSPNS